MRFRRKLTKGLIDHRIECVRRTKRFVNLDSVRTAGIIWTEHDYPAFENLVKILEQKQIKWTDLSFSDDKATRQAVNRVTKKDFSFRGLPESTVAMDFVNTEFDLLIDISLSSSIYVQAIRGLSRAACKAGWSEAIPDFFDFKIDVSRHPEPVFLVEQLTHYLSEIKTR